MSTAAVRRHWSRVAALGCVISGQPAELAHCHGASMVPLIGPKAKGKKIPRFDWLVIPLAPRYARQEYGGLDASPRAWEEQFGTQVAWLDYVARSLGVNVWQLAGIAREIEGLEQPRETA